MTGSKKILIVEDDKTWQEWISDDILAKFPGTTIDVCATMEEAKEKLSTTSYDAAIIDYQFPRSQDSTPEELGLDLIDLVRHGKNPDKTPLFPKNNEIPIHFHTSVMSPHLEKSRKQAGAASCAKKNSNSYLAFVEKLVSGTLSQPARVR